MCLIGESFVRLRSWHDIAVRHRVGQCRTSSSRTSFLYSGKFNASILLPRRIHGEAKEYENAI